MTFLSSHSVQQNANKVFVPNWITTNENLTIEVLRSLPSQTNDGKERYSEAWLHSCRFLTKHFGRSVSFAGGDADAIKYFDKESEHSWLAALNSMSKADFDALLYGNGLKN